MVISSVLWLVLAAVLAFIGYHFVKGCVEGWRGSSRPKLKVVWPSNENGLER
jgi:hypothetical protein